MSATRALGLAVLVVVAAASHGAGLTAAGVDNGTTRMRAAPCPKLRPARLRTPSRFFPADRVGAWVPVEARHCLYLVRAGTDVPVAIFRTPEGSRLRGPVWSPSGAEMGLAYRSGRGFTVAVVDPAGRVRRTYLGRDLGYMGDGRLVIGRRDRLLIVGSNGSPRPLAERSALETAAGFEIASLQLHAISGYGRAGVAVLSWGAGQSRVLLVSTGGAARAASPVMSDAQETGFPGPPAWSPDGWRLLIPCQRRDPMGVADHVHCLSRWSQIRGNRVAFCRNPHFDHIAWHPDGGTAFLNHGRVVARDGTVRARIRSFGRGWSVRWASE